MEIPRIARCPFHHKIYNRSDYEVLAPTNHSEDAWDKLLQPNQSDSIDSPCIRGETDYAISATSIRRGGTLGRKPCRETEAGVVLTHATTLEPYPLRLNHNHLRRFWSIWEKSNTIGCDYLKIMVKLLVFHIDPWRPLCFCRASSFFLSFFFFFFFFVLLFFFFSFSFFCFFFFFIFVFCFIGSSWPFFPTTSVWGR